MPLITAQTYIRSKLDKLSIPGPAGVEPLNAFVIPPDPYLESAPAAYVWPSRGTEKRQALPRNVAGANGAWKTIAQSMDVWLTWFGADTDPYADNAFPAIVDAVMNVLRTAPDPAQVTDPNTNAVTWLSGIGEDMDWHLGGVRSLEDQRWLRFDALVTVPFTEWIQA